MTELGAALEGLRPLLDWRGLPVDMASLTALAMGLGWASGLRLYALVFTLGALGRFAGVQLPGGLEVLTHPLVLGVSGLLVAVEFLADKIPYVDSLWDSVHTFIRIPAGAALAAAVMGDQGAAMQVAMALLGGGLAAGRAPGEIRRARRHQHIARACQQCRHFVDRGCPGRRRLVDAVPSTARFSGRPGGFHVARLHRPVHPLALRARPVPPPRRRSAVIRLSGA